MADDIVIPVGGAETVRAKDKSGKKAQVIIIDLGGGGAEALLAAGQQAKAASLPVVLASDSDALPVSGSIVISGQGVMGLASDALYVGSTALTPKFAKIDRATNADGAAVVSLVSAKKIRVVRYSIVCAGAVGAKWQSSTSNTTGAGSNTDLCPVMSFAANGGIAEPFCPVGVIETVAGEALKLNLNGAVQVSGYLTYIEV